MKLSNIPVGYYRPKVRRLSQGELPPSNYVTGHDTSSASSTRKWFNKRGSRISPDSSWMHNNKLRNDPNNKNDNQKNKLPRQACFLIIIAIILLLIVGAIIGIVLGLTLPKTSDTESSTTVSTSISTSNTAIATAATTSTISIMCSSTGYGNLAFQNGTIPTTWTTYSYTFVTTKTAPTLVFGFQTDGNNRLYLDTVSVFNNNTPATELLTNRNFENSTSSPTGWTVSCELATCGSGGIAGQIVTGAECSSGNCFESVCSNGRSSLIFLSQTFSTTSGDPHTVTYKLKQKNIGLPTYMAFYLGIV